MDPAALLRQPRLPLSLSDPASDAARVSPEEPARRAMTDLTLGPVSVTSTDASLGSVLQTMRDAGVRFLFVLDAGGRLVGSIGSHDVQGEKPLLCLRAIGDGRGWHELRVADVMEPVSEWRVLDAHRVDRLTVRDVTVLLAEAGRRHLVVVEDTADGAHRVRGLFSSTRLQQLLGTPLDATGRATTFAEIERAIA
jgi:CBS-domain-containing membrane protein